MFNKIYPRDENTRHDFNIKRIGEECGETAEAIRILPLAPRHIICEAPDIFAWLMGFANQFDADNKVSETMIGQRLENIFSELYPDGCKDCGFSICKCPAILPSTIGRISKEGPSFDIFQNVRGLFSLEESISYFGLVQQGVKIGENHFEAKSDNYKKFESDIQRIIDKLDSLDSLNSQTLISLTRSLSQLEILARQGMLVQSDIDKIISFIESQPSQTRSIITDFLVILSASGTFSAMTVAFSEVLKTISM
jgi:NTP pyrophosphatase (non-canonical NTP hydrolase)